ncbi:hypothetical protein Hanom_Chr15g01406361 [Helianthus anomalus]
MSIRHHLVSSSSPTSTAADAGRTKPNRRRRCFCSARVCRCHRRRRWWCAWWELVAGKNESPELGRIYGSGCLR